jgi:purine-binding chemotaxis protein CheW
VTPEPPRRPVLCVQVLGWRCAIPLEHVVETMRPLPVLPLAGAPQLVLGLAVVRGRPLPVVDAAALFGGSAPAAAGRFVSLRAPGRQLVLAVGAVDGVHDL